MRGNAKRLYAGALLAMILSACGRQPYFETTLPIAIPKKCMDSATSVDACK